MQFALIHTCFLSVVSILLLTPDEIVTHILVRKKENKEGCSSEKERKVNALALRADEGRDYLR